MPRALLSVHDKTGLIAFARGLHDMDWELVASGGTARALAEAGLPVITVEEVTGTPEMLGGRVKTLHPAIHAAILARESDLPELDRLGYTPIDLVACNLYPFAGTVASGADPEVVIEQIDIGGVTLLRAAAKNHARVIVICDPGDYQATFARLRNGESDDPAWREALAGKAFAHTRDYDEAVAEYFVTGSSEWSARSGGLPDTFELALGGAKRLRYGENPHQQGAFYPYPESRGLLGGQVLGGNKTLSYNNLLDLDAAWRAVELHEAPAVVIVKHLNPCGIAIAGHIAEGFPAALASDPVSAFGGVIAVNREVDSTFVDALNDLFVEAITAPAFTADALEMLAARRKNCRLVQMAPAGDTDSAFEFRSVRGGVLLQSIDRGDPRDASWRVVTRRAPTDDEMTALRFAWKAAQAVRSNAIVLATGGGSAFATVGIGGGLPSRVDAARLAVEKAGGRARGAVMASDAFFPFADSVQVGAAAGVTAVIAPGGSIRDEDVIAAADEAGLAMIFTGVRHFRH